MNEYTVADMHTHSENSHDSVCKIEDMLLSQIAKGTKIFAVTDHFNTSFFEAYDIFTPIKTAYDTVSELNKKYKNKCTVLAGVEMGEAFLFPEQYRKIINMLDYDVIIGSVHILNYTSTSKTSEDMKKAYSLIDFSRVPKTVIEDYLNTYFDDVLTLLKFADFDILAHLTCPLRYIKGKYGISIDMSQYDQKIENILSTVIEKGVALEINTSSFDKLNDFMPSTDIIKKYYEMGGRMITLGSDAHAAENASINFEKATTVLKAIGFENIYYYKKRKPYKILLTSNS